MKLKPKQEQFCQEYLVDLNGTQAAIRSGYSAKTAGAIAAEHLQKPQIVERIQQLADLRAKRTGITADYVLETVRETIERCRQAEPVRDRKGNLVYVNTPAGDLVPAYMFDAKNVLKGCEILGRHLNLFAEQPKAEGTLRGAFTLADLLVAQREAAQRSSSGGAVVDTTATRIADR